MKKITKLFLLLALLLVLAIPTTALAQGGQGDKYVMGGTYTLKDGETLNGNLYVLGGVATLEEGSTVNGDVSLIGGNLRANGTIDGDINAAGGVVSIGASAVVTGNVNVVAANLDRANSARIEGRVTNGEPSTVGVLPGSLWMHNMGFSFNPFWKMLGVLLRSFLWAALAVLVVLFLPHQIERASETVVTQPLIAGGLGLLTVVVFPLVLLVMAITLILIPVSLLGALALAVAWAFGIIVVGTEVGKRLTSIFHQEWALAVSAAIGVFLLTLVVNSLNAIVPCVGWLVPFIVGIVGLGAVVLTRFGTRPYPPFAPLLPVPPVPPAPPAPQV